MSAANDGKGFGLFTSTIMLKVVMALTGAGMALFVLAHMAGHLQMFLGRDAYNAYAHFMQHGLGELIWIARVGLLGLVGAHIAAAVELTKRNTAARSRGYSTPLQSRRTTTPAKLMVLSGVVIALFVVYHLSHFTIGLVHTKYFDIVDQQGRRDVYNNFVFSFQNPIILAAYIAANVALAAHLSHALSSMFKTLGIADGRFRRPLELVGPAFATICLIGFLIPPLACAVGVIKPQYGQSEGTVANGDADHQAEGSEVAH